MLKQGDLLSSRLRKGRDDGYAFTRSIFGS
jgi:hypothetical protein